MLLECLNEKWNFLKTSWRSMHYIWWFSFVNILIEVVVVFVSWRFGHRTAWLFAMNENESIIQRQFVVSTWIRYSCTMHVVVVDEEEPFAILFFCHSKFNPLSVPTGYICAKSQLRMGNLMNKRNDLLNDGQKRETSSIQNSVHYSHSFISILAINETTTANECIQL